MNKKLVIDRTKWLRGLSSGVSRLYNPRKNKMCCLGFDALACGLTLDMIRDKGSPPELTTPFLEETDEYFIRNKEKGHTIRRAIEINDDLSITDPERERRLIPVLKELRYDEVEFIN